jgi:flagellar assembly factor FliW
MTFRSARLGSFEVPEENVLTFPAGLLGFRDHVRYVILDHDTDAPFKWLQSLDDPDLAFVIMDPVDCADKYAVDVTPEALAEIKSIDSNDLSIAVILTIPSADPASVTANLRGPLVMNSRTRLGKQLVLADNYPTRHPVFAPVMNGSEQDSKSLQVATTS